MTHSPRPVLSAAELEARILADLELKLSEQRKFVLWWDGQEKRKGGSPSAVHDGLNVKEFGLDRDTLHRWRDRLKTDDDDDHDPEDGGQPEMGERTAIEWTEKTWNPWQGCRKVSPGCAHCYMYRDKARYGQDPRVVVRSSPKTFAAPLTWQAPAFVFTCSWSDFFIEDADGWRATAWAIIQRTPHLTYQILTKRPERIAVHLPWTTAAPWPHVWLGVSVESPAYVSRIAALQRTAATVRFLSLEPLLAPLPDLPLDGIGWVIVGGESGPGARPLELDWVRDIRDQCQEAAVPFFFKQVGGLRPASGGRRLDGRTWDERPTPRPLRHLTR